MSKGYVISKCYDDFPDIQFLFGDKWITVSPDDYVLDISENKDRSMCVLMLTQGEQAFFVMGLPAFMDYYTIHDEDNNRLGFVPHSNSKKGALVDGKQPSQGFESTNPTDLPVSIWSWVISSVMVLTFMACWFGVVIRTAVSRNSQIKVPVIAAVAFIFTLAFSSIVYFRVQPLINELIVGPKNYQASYRSAVKSGVHAATSPYGKLIDDYGLAILAASVFLLYKAAQKLNT